jgi:hypothetical protein
MGMVCWNYAVLLVIIHAFSRLNLLWCGPFFINFADLELSNLAEFQTRAYNKLFSNNNVIVFKYIESVHIPLVLNRIE